MTAKALREKYRQTSYRKTIRAHKKQCRIRAERQAKDKGKWMSLVESVSAISIHNEIDSLALAETRHWTAVAKLLKNRCT